MEVRNVSERQTETCWLNKMCEILPPGIQAACINAATLALIDAGIPMKDYVTAVSAGCISGKPVLDINYIEETARGPELTVAILPKTKKITTLEMESRVHADIFEGVLALAIEGCCSIEGILDKVRKSSKTRWLSESDSSSFSSCHCRHQVVRERTKELAMARGI